MYELLCWSIVPAFINTTIPHEVVVFAGHQWQYITIQYTTNGHTKLKTFINLWSICTINTNYLLVCK